MHDLILRYPAQVLCAQEVDLEFFAALQSPWEHIEEKCPDMTSAMAEARAANWGSWLVIRGTEGDEEEEKGKTQSRSCLIAVRSSRAQNIRLLESHKMFNGYYRTGGGNRNKAYSRILCAEITWWRPVKHSMYFRVITFHLHSKVARKDKGFASAFAEFFHKLAAVITRTHADILTGDFNMALFLVIPELQKRGLQTVTMVANFGWCGPKQNRPKKTSALAEGVLGADDVVTKWDSCAVFLLKPLDGPLKKCFTSSDLEAPANLTYCDNGQGYIIDSYKGKKPAAMLSMDAIHVRGDLQLRGSTGTRHTRSFPVEDTCLCWCTWDKRPFAARELSPTAKTI